MYKSNIVQDDDIDDFIKDILNDKDIIKYNPTIRLEVKEKSWDNNPNKSQKVYYNHI